jgi:hypothetical protein
VIIEARIREWETGRNSRGLVCPAAKAAAQFPAVNLMAFQAISDRELTMRRASASRPSAPRRTTRGLPAVAGICSALSNREPNLLEPSLTYRKQMTAPAPNRELSTNLSGRNSQLPLPNLPQIRKWSRPLLTGSALQTEFGLTYRKQTTEKFLTGARTHIRETRICAKISVATNEEANEAMSEEMKAIR